MKQFTNGTSALADSMCWNLCKLENADEMAAYELRVQGTADEQAPEVMMHVINGLLDGMHVGVIAESGESGTKALSRLGMDNGASLALLQKLNKVPAITDPYGCLEQNGMTVTKFTPEQVRLFFDATKAVRDKWIPQIGEELVKAAQADMAAAR